MRLPPLTLLVAARIRFPVLAFAVSVVSVGCGCDAFARASLDIAITNVRTGAPAAAGATVLVLGPAFTDSVTFGTGEGADARHYYAWEPRADAGQYTITIRKAGYQTWTRAGVRVRTSGRCDHVQTVMLTAALVPIT